MYITEGTYNALNSLLGSCFQMNSVCDNIAYNLGYAKMVSAEPIFHEKFAHAFPGLADDVSGLMLRMEARPVRYALHEDIAEYRDIEDMFASLKEYVDGFRKEIISVIEIADVNDDYEVKISMEEFLNNFKIYLDQVNTWYLKARQYGEKVAIFDKDFEKFTFI